MKIILPFLCASALALSLTACAGTINNSTADTASNVTFTFTDSGVTAAGETDTGYEIDGTALTITSSGTYTVSGSCADGSIKVKKGTTGVTLVLDGLKKWFALAVIRHRFDDDTAYTHHDPRVQATVASVPFAADFDMASLARPRIALGLVTAGMDVNQVPRFHSSAVLAACQDRCTHVAHLPGASHGGIAARPSQAEAKASAILDWFEKYKKGWTPAAKD